MKTTKEMIEVMQAYESGEQIECFNDEQWKYVKNPVWDWLHNDYRVKNKVYMPFDTAEEFLAAQRNHGYGLIGPCFIGLLKFNDIYINADGLIFIRTEDNRGFNFDYYGDLKDLFEKFKFSDGTPCGKEIEL